jgi:hypothetical protein
VEVHTASACGLGYNVASSMPGQISDWISKARHRTSDTIACMERHLTRPPGYWQAAAEQLFCWFVLCLPYYQSLLMAGLSGVLFFLLLTFLLMFVVDRSPAICHAIAICLRTLPASWAAPALDRRDRWISELLFSPVPGPSLAPSFQRPPPLFS